MARRTTTLALAILLGLVAFAYRYLPFHDFGNDHFVHLSQAQQITHGLLPVRDFVERGIPLMSLTSAAAQLAIGEGLRAEVLLVAGAYAVAAGVTLLVAAALGQSLAIGCLAALMPVLVFPVSYSYPKLLVYALALFAALQYDAKPTWRAAWGLAGALAVAFLFRHDHGVVLAFALVVLMAVRHGATRAGALGLGRVALLALVLVGPYLAWVQIYQGVGPYIRQGVAFSRRESERGDAWWTTPRFSLDRTKPMWAHARGPVIHIRWREDLSVADLEAGEARHGLRRLDPLGPRIWEYELRSWSVNALESLVHDVAVADTDGIDRSAFLLRVPYPTRLGALLLRLGGPGDGLRLQANGVALWFYAVWVLPLAALVVLMARWVDTPPALRGVVAAAIAIQLGMNVLMLRDPLDTRIRDVLIPSVALLSFIAGVAWHRGGAPAARAIQRVLVVVVLLGLVGASAAVGEAGARLAEMNASDGIEGVRVRLRELRRVVLPANRRTGPLSAAYQPLVDYVDRCTAPSSRILAMTFAPEVFFYSGRAFAGGQVTMSPGYFVTDADASLMLDRLAREDVPLVILDSETRGEMEQLYPRVMTYVRDRYRDAGNMVLSGDKRLILLVESSRPPAGRFGSGGLPCFVP